MTFNISDTEDIRHTDQDCFIICTSRSAEIKEDCCEHFVAKIIDASFQVKPWFYKIQCLIS